MKLEGITFRHAITLGPVQEDGRVEFTIEPSAPKKVGPGVYFVLEGEEVVYVGSYQLGVIRRWLYIRKKDLWHFKKPLVSARLKAGSMLMVFAQDEDSIKQELGCEHNVWVNAAGIEMHLIAKIRPPWNNQGKRIKAVH
jgi:hypothetical protein